MPARCSQFERCSCLADILNRQEFEDFIWRKISTLPMLKRLLQVITCALSHMLLEDRIFFFYNSVRIFIIPCALSLVLNHINYYSVALIRRLIDVSARECIDTKQSISFLNLSAAHVWDVLFFFCFLYCSLVAGGSSD